MANLLEVFGTDPKAELEGRWTTIHGDCKMLLARRNNPAHRRKLEQLTADRRAELIDDQIPEEELEDFANQAASTTIILDWENLSFDGESTVPYSSEAALSLLRDERLRDLRLMVFIEANSADNYRLKTIEADAKN